MQNVLKIIHLYNRGVTANEKYIAPLTNDMIC